MENNEFNVPPAHRKQVNAFEEMMIPIFKMNGFQVFTESELKKKYLMFVRQIKVIVSK